MATPDPRRGDEPGDPDITPGRPQPGNPDAPHDPEPKRDDEQPASS